MAPVKVLFVCTANRCRSPVAAAMAIRRLEVLRNSSFRVRSAGFLESGLPVPDPGLRLMMQRGFDLGAHRSSTADNGILASSAIVIGMARHHVRDVVVQDPTAAHRTFGLGEFVRRAERLPRDADTALEDWVAQLDQGRTPTDLVGTDAQDVPDPTGVANASGPPSSNRSTS